MPNFLSEAGFFCCYILPKTTYKNKVLNIVRKSNISPFTSYYIFYCLNFCSFSYDIMKTKRFLIVRLLFVFWEITFGPNCFLGRSLHTYPWGVTIKHCTTAFLPCYLFRSNNKKLTKKESLITLNPTFCSFQFLMMDVSTN